MGSATAFAPVADVDVERIARLALERRSRAAPSDTIDVELERAGVRGRWASSRDFRDLWYQCVLRYLELRAELPAVTVDELTAEMLWEGYDRAESHDSMGRRFGMKAAHVSGRSLDLGFVLERGYQGFVVKVGPCAGCARSFDVDRLDGARRCATCRR